MKILTATGQQDAFAGMSRMLDLVLLAMLALVAIYSLYTAIRLKKEYMLFPNRFLYPSGCTPETCLDPWEYIDYIIPKLVVLGVVCLVLTVAYAVRIFVFPHVNSVVIEIATVFLPFGILTWYAIIQNKVSKTFW